MVMGTMLIEPSVEGLLRCVSLVSIDYQVQGCRSAVQQIRVDKTFTTLGLL